MDGFKLSVHHVGGRAGSRSFPHMKYFEKDIINILYDADADCVAQITDRNKRLDSELHVFPYVLGDSCKSEVLNINYDPYTSSLFELDKSFDSFYMFNHDHDYIMGETFKTVEKRDVEMVSIDHLFRSNSLNLPKPDFLSIDVEGGEYGVLEGASKTMKSSVLAIDAEVSFYPMRKGQKNFGQLCDLLLDYGFYFANFANSDGNIYMEEMAPYRYPIGLRGAGFHMLSEALFLRKIDVVENMFPDSLIQYINLRKLAFISIIFNQIEYGLECLKHSRLIHLESKPDESSEANYSKFLRELEKDVEIHPKIFPKTFKSIYTFEESKGRFAIDNKKAKFKSIARKIPGLRMLYKLVFKIKCYLIKKLKTLILLKRNSNFEKVFIKYLLFDQARILKQKRITQQLHL